MNLAYLMNTYPLTSTTFIRREIEALERRGVTVKRYAVRQWDGALADPLDRDEIGRTEYLLTGNAPGLIASFFRELIVNPGGVIKAAGPWFSLMKNARGGFVRHAAYLLEAISFRQRAAAAKIDHVHVHFLTNSTAVAMLARIMGGPSYSVTVHGPDELTDALLLSFPEKIRHASFIAAITHYCKSQLIRFSSIENADKIHIVHCALDVSSFTPNDAFDPADQTFVCVGRLCPQKGQAQIPGAVAALRAEFPEMKVILIGGGESRPDVEAAIKRHGVEDMVEIMGWMANDKVRETVAGSRALLLPSYAEGLPVVIMEALALGRPVISTYIAGIPELVDEGCGWIIPAGSEEALVTAMREALNAPPELLAAKGVEGRKRIERDHDSDKEAAKLHAMFEKTVDGQLL